jgi:hypothetical protein
MKYVIFDLDNCLADDRERIKLINWQEQHPDQRYADYHRDISNDLVGNYDKFISATLNATPVFLTARPHTVGRSNIRLQTMYWLKEHLGVEDPILLMRNVGDHRPSVELKRMQLSHLSEWDVRYEDIVCAYDDREDVVAMYKSFGIRAEVLAIHLVDAMAAPMISQTNAGDVLGAMAATFRERSGAYKDNYKMVPKLCEVLFPNGVPPEVLFTPQWHLFELKLVKLSRFAISNLQHLDSIHDDAVYSAMIEACLINSEKLK